MQDPFAHITVEDNPTDYNSLLSSAAKKYGIPDRLPILQRIMQIESGGNPNARSPKGASGLMQLMPGTAKGLGVTNINDPQQNIDAGVRYYADQLKQFGSDDLALAAYNAGPGAVRKHGGIPPYKETQAYVSNILSPISGTLGGGFNDSRGDRLHYGGDIAAASGTPFIAPTRMMITNVRDKMSNSPGGMVWGIDPSSGLQFRFHHVQPGVKQGDMVEAGTPLGTLADISGPHLDMKVYNPKTGEFVDWLEQNKLQRGDIFAQGQPIGRGQMAINPNVSNMVADVSGQTVPSVAPVQSHEKQQTISQILSDLAQKMGPSQAQAAEPSKPTIGQQLVKEAVDPFSHITVEDPFSNITVEPQELTTGQKIARTVAPYTKYGLPMAGMAAAGLAASPTLATPMGPVAEAGALGFGTYVGNKAQSALEEYAGLKQPPANPMEALKEEGKNIVGSAIEGTSAMIGGKLTEGALNFLANKIAPGIYQSVLKPSTVMDYAQKQKLLNFGLKEGIPVNMKGAEKLDKIMDVAQAEIDGLVSDATQKGGLISTKAVVRKLDDLIQKFKQTDTPSIYIQKIRDYQGQLLQERAVMSPDEAHEIKKNMWQVIKDATFSKDFPVLSEDMKRSFGQGLKTELEQLIPGLKELNADQGNRIEFMKILNKAVGRIDNRYPVSLYDVVSGSAVGEATKSVPKGVIMTLVSKVLLDPTVNSYVAMALKRMPMANYQGLFGKAAGLGAGMPIANRAEQRIGESWNTPDLVPNP